MKQTKKKPINVQLSKEDLTELLVVLKDFMTEEFSIRNKRLFLNQTEMGRRITSLEIENSRREGNHKLKQHCLHEDVLDCISYSQITGTFLAAVYKCRWCERENSKTWYFLTRKEKKALRNLGVKIA